jgi:2-phosphosulfolactate phosphatase
MTAHAPASAEVSGFDVRLGWGPVGVQSLCRNVGSVVLVDVLRFTTALDVAVTAGARVLPAPWPFDPSRALPDGVELADGTGPRALTLSPSTLTALGPGDRIVLPSANGSHCSALAAEKGRTVVGGSLRNADAVARWILHQAGDGVTPVGVVPCGERWADGSLRPALEDLVGAGAIVHALLQADSSRLPSPDAAAAAAAFCAVAHDLAGTLAASVSGRELLALGRQEDIGWAAALNVSRTVPVLGDDGAYGPAEETSPS